MALETSGCRFLVIDAYPKAVSWYKRFGFQELPSATSGTNVKLFLDLTRINDLAEASLKRAADKRTTDSEKALLRAIFGE